MLTALHALSHKSFAALPKVRGVHRQHPCAAEYSFGRNCLITGGISLILLGTRHVTAIRGMLAPLHMRVLTASYCGSEQMTRPG